MRRAEENGSKVTLGKGRPAVRERWPFSKLKAGGFFQVDDMTQWVALRTAANRAGKKLGSRFSVRKAEARGKEVIRVYIVTG